ncbi:MAG: Asp-tRNA(Asn)/Glu-tRNA(Gln) amidotransferase subunit GatA [Candidatus Magasanikbacteria bacterium]|mgnify:CR=1 FL=1|jgi:aspartyl-tRNA(Asn)/glutamyl-tRNA(Gln) amidotransferase subunit A|nr:Asp-tRNA(Asn)/Glu-tRNA(Gln) amidotransferase subunit GatA [Candidatus Magasanikbacteria bacterium]MBT4314889.1 Asp-tRNA(Asn)/Glu-tRNA(Gln) amidotransferase subunit GatA [Candidatus Magasanikbacteria bacterium]MBT4546845.1 Asp-tRNA(Asn)/Glu-tRNA(Gln) amidotransferase subunit GatA [Candidatus Magasanikbacteria bacterium]MBT6819282.1 Asp-tRNA(Asn)/Glu-tRNA(Gln) amidotransferase subunit GatA [Candidatus Magasanikbacteria bacterium]
MELNRLTIIECHDGLKKGDFTSVELTQACLDRIKKRNKKINAFISVFEKEALEEAKKADEMIATDRQQELTGIPFAVKDAINTIDRRSTGGGKILDNYISPYEATVITKIREQGAVLIGKNNCDAFGHGASNEQSMYGPVRNPHDEKHVSGGSSGGSAVSVADHQCIFSIGEDTGGSIRQPASFCGVVGLRPSYGRNSRYGIMPMASSLDTVGPLTKTVEDCAIVQKIIEGRDKKDATTVETQDIASSKKKLRVGVPKEYFNVEGMDEEVKKIIEGKIQKLGKNKKIEIMPVSLPMTKYAIPVYYLVVPSEDSSNMGRLDGVRYGVQAKHKTLYDLYAKSRAEGFPEEVKRRIMIGTYALSAGYYDAYYKKAQKVRTLIRQDFERVFSDPDGSASGGVGVDLLVTPTSPFPAFKVGEKKDDILAMYLADVLVAPAAVAGLPAISVPAGKTKKGLPVGLQIIGNRLEEEKIFQLADFI